MRIIKRIGYRKLLRKRIIPKHPNLKIEGLLLGGRTESREIGQYRGTSQYSNSRYYKIGMELNNASDQQMEVNLRLELKSKDKYESNQYVRIIETIPPNSNIRIWNPKEIPRNIFRRFKLDHISICPKGDSDLSQNYIKSTPNLKISKLFGILSFWGYLRKFVFYGILIVVLLIVFLILNETLGLREIFRSIIY